MAKKSDANSSSNNNGKSTGSRKANDSTPIAASAAIEESSSGSGSGDAGGSGDASHSASGSGDSSSSSSKGIKLNGSKGDDTLTGTDGNDTINGKSGDDFIDGGAGDDKLTGGKGNDTILGGDGNDKISGGNGADFLDGGAGDDHITGGNDADTVFGGTGNDRIDTGNGDDWVDGGDGDDTINTGNGNDTIYAGAGNDDIKAGNGDDFIDAGAGDDTIKAQQGDDIVHAGAGNDHVDAGAGNDTVEGGAGNDIISGGAGSDTLLGQAGDDILYGDAMPGSGSGSSASLSGGSGSGSGDFNDYLDGGAGNDRIYAQQGDDTGHIQAEENWDNTNYYDGGTGTDTLEFTMTYGEALAAQQDFADFDAFLAANSNPNTDSGPIFQFTSFDFAVADWEAYNLTLVNTDPVAVDDTGATDEDTVAAGNVLTNDYDNDHLDQIWVQSHDAASAAGAAVTVAADGSYTYDPAPVFQWLAVGETATDTFSYVIRDLAGATSMATVILTVTGTNDFPIVTATDTTGAITERADLSAGENVDTLSDSGTIDFFDVDLSDSHTVSVSESGSGYRGGMVAVVNDDSTGDQTGQITWTFSIADADIDDLAAGQTLVQSYDLTVDDGNGGTATETVTITVTGTNDAPLIESANTTGAVTEIADLAAGENVDTLSDAGTIEFSDVDLTDAHSVSSSANGSGYRGTFTAVLADDSTGDTAGQIAWNFTIADADIDDLAAGQTLVQSYDVTVDDGNGGTATETVTITVTGTNDAPVIESSDTVGGVTEIADLAAGENVDTLSDTGTIELSDVDLSDAHTVSVAENGSGYRGSLVAVVNDDSTGDVAGQLTWTYSINDADIDDLAAGQTLVQSYDVTVDDGNGGTATETVTITVTGTNDAPVIGTADTLGSVKALVAESAPPSTPLTVHDEQYLGYNTGNCADLEAWAASHAPSYTADTTVIDYTDDPGGFAGEIPGANPWPAAAATGASGTGAAVNNNFFARITAEFSVSNADIYTFRTFNDDGVRVKIDGVTVIQDSGYHPEYAFNGSIHLEPGLHDIEIYFFEGGGEASLEFSVRDSSGSYGLVGGGGGGLGGVVTQITDSGVIDFTDVDLSDGHSVTVAANGSDYLGELSASVTDVSSGDGAGQVSWNFAVDNADVVYLAEGETLTQSYTVTIDDGHGGTDSEVVTVTLVGTNDGPVAHADSGTTDENAAITLDVLANDTDVDLIDTHTVDAVSIANGLGAVSIVGNQVVYDPGSTYDYLAIGESATVTIDYTMSDNNGATSANVVTITVTGSNDGPIAVADTATTDENASIALDVLGNDTDLDASDTHTLDSVSITSGNGSASIVNNELVWNPGSDYDYLAVGESATVTVQYTMSDNHGASATSTATITVTGSNDGPVAVADTRDTDADTAVTIDVLANDSDVDASDVLTITAASSNGGGTVSIVNNQLVFDPNGDFSHLTLGQLEDVTLTYSIADGHGGTDTATVTVTVEGTNTPPDAIDDSASTTENAGITVAVLANDVDPDPGEILTVTAASIVSGNGSVSTDGTNVSWNPGSDYDYLAAGETATVTLSYTIEDRSGVSDTATVTLTVSGTNDGPSMSVTGSAAIVEAVDATAQDITDSGTVSFDDIDASDVIDISFSPNGDIAWSGGPLAAGVAAQLVAGFSTAATDAAAPGSVAWTYDVNGVDLDFLNAGDTLSFSYTVTATDSAGASASDTVSFSITGTNDAPTVNAVSLTGAAVSSYEGIAFGGYNGSGSGVVLSGLYDSNGDGVVDSADTASDFAAGNYSYGLASGDLDGDGDADLAIATNNGIFSLTNIGDTNGDGDVEFVATQLTSGYVYDVAIADLDNDGTMDIVAKQAGVMYEMLNNGDVNGDGIANDFTTRTISIPNQSYSYGVTTADLNGDGWTDILSAGYSNGPTVISYGLGDTNGDGQLDYSHQIIEDAYDEYGLGVDVGDIDGDGDLDFVLSRWSNANEVVYLNDGDSNGDGQLEFSTIELPTGDSTLESQLVDLDGDGDLDIVSSSYSGNVQLSINQGDTNGDGRVDFLFQEVANSYVNGSYGIAAADLDGDGDVDIVVPAYYGNETRVLSNLGDTNGDGVPDFAWNYLSGATGAWDAEIFGQVGGAVGVQEDGDAQAGSFDGSDPDAGETATLTYVITSAPTEGSVVNNNDGSFSFDPGSDFQDLAVGETRDVSFEYHAVDVHGAISNTATVTITVAGTNDGVTVTSADTAGSVTELTDGDAGENSTTLSTSGVISYSDIDLNDVHVVSVVANGSGYLGTLSAAITDSATGDGSGALSWTFDVADSALESMGAGESLTQSYQVTVSDGFGGSATETVDITLNGSNDAPTAQDIALQVNQLGNGGFETSPDFAGWTVSTATSGMSSTNSSWASIDRSGNAIAGDDAVAVLYFDGTVPYGYGTGYGPTITSDAFQASAGDSVRFVYELSSGGDQAIGAGYIRDANTGAVVQTIFNYQVPFSGSTGTQTVELSLGYTGEFTIDFRVGSYDATGGLWVGAQLELGYAGVIKEGVSEDSPITFAGDTFLAGATDPDANDTVSLYAVNALSANGAAVSINGNGEVVYDPTNAATLQALAAGDTLTDSFTFTVTDGHGGFDTKTASIKVYGQNDAPVASDDSGFALASTPVVLDVLGNDTDLDGDALSISSVSSASHGTVAINGDGTLSYTPTSGYSGDDSFTYVVSDGHGGTDTATVSMIVGLADHQTVGTDVFLQGNYMELGIANAGSLGSANAAPSGYHPKMGSGQISYVVDTNGWDTAGGSISGDFTLPGSPVDGFAVGYKLSGSAYRYADDERSGYNQMNATTTDTSNGSELSATTVGQGGWLAMTQVIELGASDTYYMTTITFTNTGASAIDDVRYMRSFDPDQDVNVGGSYATNNDVLSNPTGDNNIAVSQAYGGVSGVSVNLVAFDTDARGSNFGFSNRDVYTSQAWDSPVDLNGAYVDQAITMTLNFGTIAAGESVTKSFYTSLNGQNTANDMPIGTNGADTINGGAGDDIILGLGGNDTLTGGVGNDLFVFASGNGADTITDFTTGVASDDVIDIQGVSGFASFADVQAAAAQVGADTVLDLGGGDSITLSGVNLSSLHADDFLV